MSPEALFSLALIGGVALVILTAIAIILRPRGKKLAQVEAREGEPFEMQARPHNAKPCRVWVRYKVAWEGKARRSPHYGLACKVRCLVEDQLVFEEVVGVGSRHVEGLPRTKEAGKLYGCVSSARFSSGSDSASIILGETGARAVASGVAVTG